jgi:hypothetical protein
MCEGLEVYFHVFLIFTLDGGEWEPWWAPTPSPVAKEPLGGLVGPRASLGAVVKKSLPLMGIEPSGIVSVNKTLWFWQRFLDFRKKHWGSTLR